MQNDVEEFLLPRRCCQACRYEAKETHPLLPFEHDLLATDDEEQKLKHICPKGTYIIHKISKIFQYKFIIFISGTNKGHTWDPNTCHYAAPTGTTLLIQNLPKNQINNSIVATTEHQWNIPSSFTTITGQPVTTQTQTKIHEASALNQLKYPMTLKLNPGDHLMYLKNTNVVQGLANGSILTVERYNPIHDTITVRVKKNNQIFILTRLNFKLEVHGYSKLRHLHILQSTFPVHYIRAMTIHKGQGDTISQVIFVVDNLIQHVLIYLRCEHTTITTT